MAEKEYLSTSKRTPEALIKRLLEISGKEYGTPHGLMLLRGELTKTQYAACNWFDGLYERYIAALGLPRGVVTSTGERRDRGHEPDPDSDAGKKKSSREKESIAQYKSARVAAMAAGPQEFYRFFSTVIDGEIPTSVIWRGSVAKVAALLEKYRMRNWKSRKNSRW